MNEPTKEQLLEFMRKNYGEQWATEDKLDLALILWKKKYGGKYVAEVPTDYQQSLIADMQVGGAYKVEAIVIDAQNVIYEGCPICRRSVKKACNHLQSGQTRPVPLLRVAVKISDGSGETMADGVWQYDDNLKLYVGDLVRFYGKFVELRDGSKRMILDKIEVLKRVGGAGSSGEGLNSNNGSKVNNNQNYNKLNSQAVSQKTVTNDVFDDDFGFGVSDVKKEVKVNNNNNVRAGRMASTITDDAIKMLRLIDKFGKVKDNVFERMVKKAGLDVEMISRYIVREGDMVTLNEEGRKLIGQDLSG